MNVFKYGYETRDKSGNKHMIRFQWITSLELTKRNLEEMIDAGRGRWKIENEDLITRKMDYIELNISIVRTTMR